MRSCLRRRRCFNGSGADGPAEPRTRAAYPASTYPFWLSLVFLFTILTGVCYADDTDVDLIAAIDNTEREHDAAERQREQAAMDDAAEDMRQDDLDRGTGPKMIFRNRQAGTSYSIGFYTPHSCTCTGPQPDPECDRIYLDVHWAVLCKRLELDPDAPVFNVTQGHIVDLAYPWDEELEEGEVHQSFDDRADYDDNPDVFAWWNHCQAVMRIPLHKVGCREFDVSGQPLRGTGDVAAPANGLVEAQEEDICVRDDTLVDYILGNEGDEGDELVEYTQGDEGDEGDEGDAGLCAHEPEDTFESELHSDVDSFLRFNILPFALRAKRPEESKQRKSWMQNARRRYQLRPMPDGEDRLYHVRGVGDTKKRKIERSVPSMVRSKFYKYRLVLYKSEALAKIQEDHNIHHDEHNTAEPRLNEMYFVKGLREKVQAVGGNNCSVCASHEPVKKKPTVPILTSRRGELVMFDLTKFYVPVQRT
jgi:hypothetical protein